MTDNEKAFLLTVALAAFESVRDDELIKSARRTRMDRCIDRLVELIDIYRPEAWSDDLLFKAGNIVDEFNIRIKQEFGES